MFAAESGYLEVETRIVHEDKHIGAERQQALVRNTEIAAYSGQVCQHGDDTHICHLAVVLTEFAPRTPHFVPPKSDKLGGGVLAMYLLDEVGGMQVARCLARNDEVSHRETAMAARIYGIEPMSSPLLSFHVSVV